MRLFRSFRICAGAWRRQDGYNLVVLAVMFTAMNIMLAKALPQWSTQIQRQKEAELIFRGLQYAEAIRVFKLRFNRAPVRLQELIEVEPRCIRQLWNNPLSPDAGKESAAIGWEPIFEGDRNRGNRQQRQNRQQQDDQDQQSGFGPSAFGGPQQGEEVKVGPILGVRSKEGEKAIKLFFDSDSIAQWRFTPDILAPRPLIGGGPTPMPQSASLIGKPWPPGINPLVASRPNAGNPGNPRNPRNPGNPRNRGNNLPSGRN